MHRLVLVTLVATAALPQSRPAAPQRPPRMEITLERFDAAQWKAVDPGHVFSDGDRLRFRFRANFPGYLYVTNFSTAGNNTLLFPRQDTGSDNRIAAGKEYLVPATQGAFRVTGPAGHDVVSWTVSPVELGRPAEPAHPAPPQPSATMTPRCDETLLRARGDCVDTTAGPKAPKDLVVIRGRGSSVLSSPAPLTAPVVYEFRLAHK